MTPPDQMAKCTVALLFNSPAASGLPAPVSQTTRKAQQRMKKSRTHIAATK
jgi:hypothetical protein